ncbi:MAG: ribbon-helix-helix domain-containing protein [candidate division Zixibacteria bacterium]|nr:ribbon-helix-helix domain-containing protein [candidate division Zixibacteria bacterium]
MKRKSEIVTFKVDESLLKILKGIPNRSNFIRSALLSALDNTCPLCMGTGILTPAQRSHWEQFAQDHSIEECNNCHEMHLVCSHDTESHKRSGECIDEQ